MAAGGLIGRALAALVVLVSCNASHEAAAAAADDFVGLETVHLTTAEDTLMDIAVATGVGFAELLAANPDLDPWLPEPGRRVSVPTRHILPPGPRRGLVINLAELRLYWFPDHGPPETFPVGIGTEESGNVRGTSRIVGKRVHPVWTPPASVRADTPDLPATVPPGPDNPLGDFALDTGWTAVAIHGTNKPYGVGRRVSHGCFRLYPRHIAALFPRVAIGTPVSVVDEPVKFGWADEVLWIEVHATAGPDLSPLPGLPTVAAAALDAAGEGWMRLSWPRLLAAMRTANGLPTRIMD